MKKFFKIVIVIAAFIALGAVTPLRISDVVGLYTELANRPKISDGVNPWDYVYSKKQVQALPIQEQLIVGLQNYGSTVKALPFGVTMSDLFASTTTLLDGVIFDAYVQIKDTVSITGVGWVQQTTGAYTADNYNGWAICSTTGGVDTKIVETANDGNIWKAAVGVAQKAFPAPQVLLPGNYKILALYNTSAPTTAPIIYAHTAVSGNIIYLLPNSQKMTGTLTAQTTMPSTVTNSGLTNATNYLGFYLY